MYVTIIVVGLNNCIALMGSAEMAVAVCRFDGYRNDWGQVDESILRVKDVLVRSSIHDHLVVIRVFGWRQHDCGVHI